MAHDAERALHHVDLVRLLELSLHGLEVASAGGTDLIRLVQLMDDLHDREVPLLVGTVPRAPFLPFFVGLVLSIAPSLGGITKEHLRTAGELLLEEIDLELEALRILPARLGQLCHQGLDATEQPCVLLLQKHRSLAQPLDVRLRRQVQQRFASWRNGVRTCGEVVGGESRKTPGNVQPSRKSASSLGVSSHTSCSSRCHSEAKRPRSSLFW